MKSPNAFACELSLEFSQAVFDTLEDFGRSDAKHLRQVFLKILSLRRSPRPPDSEQLAHFTHRGLTGFRVTQGEYRIIYAIDEKMKMVKPARIHHRDRDYRELEHI
jgi:mRNA-degrading endonuclease RelE of RelBE toxin-antitoxin system